MSPTLNDKENAKFELTSDGDVQVKTESVTEDTLVQPT